LIPHPTEDHKKVIFTQILVEVEVKVVKLHFQVDTKACTVDIINMKVYLMEVDEDTLEEEEVMIQIATVARNMGTW
jgi:hypothetical protein